LDGIADPKLHATINKTVHTIYIFSISNLFEQISGIDEF